MLLKIIIISFLLLPFLASASITMNPAKATFPSDKPFKAGEKYTLEPDFQVGNTDEETRSFKVSVMCFSDKNCIPKEWISFEPTEFTLEPHRTQLIHAEMIIPRNVDPREYYKDYEFIVGAETIANSTEGEGAGMSYGVAVGSIVSFKLAGKIPWHKALLYGFQNKFGNKMLASMDSVGISPKGAGIVSLILVGGYTLIFGSRKIIREIMKK